MSNSFAVPRKYRWFSGSSISQTDSSLRDSFFVTTVISATLLTTDLVGHRIASEKNSSANEVSVEMGAWRERILREQDAEVEKALLHAASHQDENESWTVRLERESEKQKPTAKAKLISF